MKTLCIFLCSFCISAFAVAKVNIVVPPVVMTSAVTVSLGDIAEIDTSSAEQAKQIKKIVVGAFPADKKLLRLQGDAIRVRLDMAGIAYSGSGISIPQQVTLVREKSQFEDEQARFLFSVIPDQEPGLQQTEYKKRPRVAQKKVKVQPKEKGSLKGIMLKTSVSAGEIITANDLTVVTFRRPRLGVLQNIAEVVGKRALRNLRHRTVLSADMIGAFDVVQGDRIRVQARRKGFVIESLAQANQNGVAGEMITVVNPRTRKVFSARVMGPGLVEVIF